jgi:tetratricopeptide (TPR) repeat protein
MKFEYSDVASMPILHRWLICLSLLVAAPVWADDVSDVRRMQAEGRHVDALAHAEKALASKPKDAQLRFLRAVSLAEVQRVSEAMAAFESLIQDHPELAEPYNNLAALQAARGEFDQARVSLEQALRADPGYAVAHENLGDVYAALAARSWSQALRLAPDNRGLATKLTIARELLRAPAAPN